LRCGGCTVIRLETLLFVLQLSQALLLSLSLLQFADTWGMHDSDIGAGWMIVMMLGMVVFWGLVIVGVVCCARRSAAAITNRMPTRWRSSIVAWPRDRSPWMSTSNARRPWPHRAELPRSAANHRSSDIPQPESAVLGVAVARYPRYPRGADQGLALLEDFTRQLAGRSSRAWPRQPAKPCPPSPASAVLEQ
jgi:hypothetical protein